MPMDRVLVTGGCGFIGSNLVRELHHQGYSVSVFDNFHRGDESNLDGIQDEVEIITGDVRDTAVVEDAMDGADYVFHLAAVCLNRSIEYPTESLHTNIIGTNNVFQAAAKESVERLFYASSASIYGDGSQQAQRKTRMTSPPSPHSEGPPPMHEEDLPNPSTPYGAAKLFGEHLCEFYSEFHELDYIAYRFFNVYGPGQHTDAYYTNVINIFIDRLLSGEPPIIHGDGDQTLDFVHVDDIVRALCKGIEADDTNFVVNVGSGKKTTIKELSQILIDITDSNVEPEYKPRDVIAGTRQADTNRAERKLNFETEVPLREGLKTVLEDRR